MKTQYEHYKQVQADSEVYCRDLRVVKLDEPEDEPKLARYLLRSKGLRRGYSWFEVVVLHHAVPVPHPMRVGPANAGTNPTGTELTGQNSGQ